MKHLIIAIAALSFCATATTGCASDDAAQPAPTPVAQPAAPVYPPSCNKLRQCIDAYKAQAPSAAPEYESLWNKVKSANSRSATEARDFCDMSLRGYANKTGAPMSCK